VIGAFFAEWANRLGPRGDMTQTSNRVLDEFAKLMTDAAGVAQGVRREVETAVRGQAERFLGDMNVVQREEFEAVRDMAVRARDENETLRLRVQALEARLGAGAPDTGAPDTGGTQPLKMGTPGETTADRGTTL
jgi:BMFP domain-containing protein YqiC